jgi:hypothetical protein
VGVRITNQTASPPKIGRICAKYAVFFNKAAGAMMIATYTMIAAIK